MALLKKYFFENRKREHYAIDSAGILTEAKSKIESFITADKTILYGLRDINHGHFPYSKSIFNYKFNVNLDPNVYTMDDVLNNISKGNGMFNIGILNMHSSVEKKNFTEFIYSEYGFRFCSKLFTAVNIDGTINLGKCIPKVDWTREWTVEEILADYKYTEEEIKEVMDDLVNFKYMED